MKHLFLIAIFCLLLGFSSCGTENEPPAPVVSENPQSPDEDNNNNPTICDGKYLTVFYSLSGNSANYAYKIQNIAGGDILVITV